jgi:response regulator RpfG family c-di-GMP phosphodiesterase
MNEKILFVDDDVNLLAGCERSFRRKFRVETAEGGELALKKIAESGPYAVVISDRQMPSMDGIQFLSLVRERAPDSVRIMLTGNADLEGAIKVVNEGNIFRFLTKPCAHDVLAKAVEDALVQYRLVVAEKELLNKTLGGSIKLLTDILGMLDPKSFGRMQVVRQLIAHIGQQFKFENDWEIPLAFMLAPIGNVTVPAELLQRWRAGAALTTAETQAIAQLPETAARLIDNIPRMAGVARIIRYHRKNFDGTGNPVDTVKGSELPSARASSAFWMTWPRLKIARPAARRHLMKCKCVRDVMILPCSNQFANSTAWLGRSGKPSSPWRLPCAISRRAWC